MPLPRPLNETSQPFENGKSNEGVWGQTFVLQHPVAYRPQQALPSSLPKVVMGYPAPGFPYDYPHGLTPPTFGLQPLSSLAPMGTLNPLPQLNQDRRLVSQSSTKSSGSDKSKPAYQGEMNDQGEESLSDLPEAELSNAPIDGKAYERRNVYKCIVRHIHTCMRKNREQMMQILKTAGYSIQNIEHAFIKVDGYSAVERQHEPKARSRILILKMLSKKTIYTYMLRETLNAMMQLWKQGKYGRVNKDNLIVYQHVCQNYYSEVVRILGKEAEGKQFVI